MKIEHATYNIIVNKNKDNFFQTKYKEENGKDIII